jgi:RpiR family transcriptional regulator, carbohydrate utilization regulator
MTQSEDRADGPSLDSAAQAGQEAGCLDLLRRALPTLTGVRHTVAEMILHDPWSLRGLSIVALAQRAGVSENAVSRLTHALGYSGYREFAQALSLDLGKNMGLHHAHPVDALRRDGEPEPTGSMALVQRVVRLEIECMQDTLANLSEPALQNIITSLVEARHVVLVGTGTAAPLCQMLTYRLSSTGVAASWTNDPMIMLADVNRLNSEDLLLGISYSGRSRDTIQALNYGNSRGVPTFGITASPDGPISDVCRSVLTIFSSGLASGTAQFSARVAGMALLEAIATAVSVRRNGQDVPLLHQLSTAQSVLNDLPAGWRPQE